MVVAAVKGKALWWFFAIFFWISQIHSSTLHVHRNNPKKKKKSKTRGRKASEIEGTFFPHKGGRCASLNYISQPFSFSFEFNGRHRTTTLIASALIAVHARRTRRKVKTELLNKRRQMFGGNLSPFFGFVG